jgi:hypothetical protein
MLNLFCVPDVYERRLGRRLERSDQRGGLSERQSRDRNCRKLREQRDGNRIPALLSCYQVIKEWLLKNTWFCFDKYFLYLCRDSKAV